MGRTVKEDRIRRYTTLENRDQPILVHVAGDRTYRRMAVCWWFFGLGFRIVTRTSFIEINMTDPWAESGKSVYFHPRTIRSSQDNCNDSTE